VDADTEATSSSCEDGKGRKLESAILEDIWGMYWVVEEGRSWKVSVFSWRTCVPGGDVG
jgi:hypothetical protein